MSYHLGDHLISGVEGYPHFKLQFCGELQSGITPGFQGVRAYGTCPKMAL